jgi:hypothetical protein
MKKLKVGYILDEGFQSNLIFDLIERSLESQQYSIEYLIVQNLNRVKKRNFKKYLNLKFACRTVTSLFFRFIIKFEKRSLLKYDEYKKYFQIYDLDKIHIPRIEVFPLKSKSGFIFKYSADDIEKIKKLDLDVLIRGGSGILRGEILKVCPYGILSLHHGNNDINRGGPPGFWEVYYRIPETGFIIQRLLNELDGGDVYFKGMISTSPSYLMNLVRVSTIANIYFDKLLNDIGKKNEAPKIYSKKPYSQRLYKLPSIEIQLLYLFTTFLYKIGRIISYKMGFRLRWNVAYGFNDNWENVEFRKFNKIENPPNRFYADPFLWSENDNNICFVEDYDYKTLKGKISAITLTKNGYSELGTVIEEEFHMSYPYLFKAEGDLFMCPETYESRDIRLYKCKEFPLKWELHKVIMKNISASDTNIFFYKDKWWMLSNLDSSIFGDHCSELHLFYANDFDSNDWTAHPSNPIIFSPLRARNAGFLYKENCFYRVFQIQGFDNYGESMGIAKIVEISEENYIEEVIFDIKPSFFPNLQGTHTFTNYSNVNVIDYSKFEKIK